jgi:hypothetical protein
VFAKCAIDALGVPAMLGADAVIITADPASGHPITVTVRNGQPVAESASTVVFVAAHPSGGPSADTCCDYLNFFTDRPAAQAWAHAHLYVTGEPLDLADATQLSGTIFGTLLDS